MHVYWACRLVCRRSPPSASASPSSGFTSPPPTLSLYSALWVLLPRACAPLVIPSRCCCLPSACVPFFVVVVLSVCVGILRSRGDGDLASPWTCRLHALSRKVLLSLWLAPPRPYSPLLAFFLVRFLTPPLYRCAPVGRALLCSLTFSSSSHRRLSISPTPTTPSSPISCLCVRVCVYACVFLCACPCRPVLCAA